MTAEAPGEPAATAESYDYVVVGSGAGGGPVAARLAAAGMRVLLLEAGGDEEGYHYRVPAFHGLATEDEALRWDFWVRHYADDAQQRRNTKFDAAHDGVLYPRAATLGGCTAHNAMITIYPHNADWDAIARITGDDSWSAAQMRRYFERLERCSYIDRPRRLPRNRWLAQLLPSLPWLGVRWRNTSGHGWDGWLGTTMADPWLPIRERDWELVDVLRAAAKKTLGDHLGRRLEGLEDFDTLRDPNDVRVEENGPLGLWSTPLAVSGVGRNGTRELLRSVAAEHPGNLTIRLHALATRVLLDDENRAYGVEYLDGAHLYRADPNANGRGEATPRTVHAEREVVLSGGTFNSPQLLMLSGIGPREELDRHDIEVRVERPGVGQNLQDRYEVGVIYRMKDEFELLEGLTFAPPEAGEQPDPAFRKWLDGEAGEVYDTNGVVVAIIRKSGQELDVPDLIIFGIPATFRGYYRGYSRDTTASKRHFTWAILKAHTKNTGGRVRLRSDDPREPPAINFHYFEEGTDSTGADLDAMVIAIKFVRSLMGGLGGMVEAEELPGRDVGTDEELRAFVRDEAWGHHATCTCKMGAPEDPEAVVDSAFRVYGTKGLRVVDASIFPAIPGFFVVTSVYMVAEKASDAILAAASTPA